MKGPFYGGMCIELMGGLTLIHIHGLLRVLQGMNGLLDTDLGHFFLFSLSLIPILVVDHPDDL